MCTQEGIWVAFSRILYQRQFHRPFNSQKYPRPAKKDLGHCSWFKQQRVMLQGKHKVSYTEVFLAHKWSEEIFLAFLAKQYNKRLRALGKQCPLKLIRDCEIKDEGPKTPGVIKGAGTLFFQNSCMTANTPVGQCRQFMRACNLLIEFWVRKMEQHLIDAIYYNIWMFICQHQTENNTEKSKLLNSNRLKNSLLHFISYLWCLRVKQWEA